MRSFFFQVTDYYMKNYIYFAGSRHKSVKQRYNCANRKLDF